VEGLRAYAFVLVFLAHAADGRLSERELDTIRRQVHRHARDLGYTTLQTEDMVLSILDDYQHVLDLTGEAAVLGRFRRSIQHLCDLYGADPKVLAAIQTDMRSVAAADGSVIDMEGLLISHFAETWWRLRR